MLSYLQEPPRQKIGLTYDWRVLIVRDSLCGYDIRRIGKHRRDSSHNRDKNL
jgi:hypothetical protein